MTASAGGSRNQLASRLEELDRVSEALESPPAAGSSCTALRLNYALRKQELEIPKEELSTKWANAKAEFQHEHNLKMLNIRLKESEECSISRHIDLLNKQMEYACAMQQLGLGGDTSTAGIPSHMPPLPGMPLPLAALPSAHFDTSHVPGPSSSGLSSALPAVPAHPPT
jgi:hypothetical protein